MEPNDNSNNSSESSSFCRDEKVEALDLLEDCWYFDNMLNIRPRIPRCHSDPSPSFGLINPDFLGKDSDVSSNSSSPSPSTGLISPKFLGKDHDVSSYSSSSGYVPPKRIQRAPSMPPLRVREEDEKKTGSSFTRSKLVQQASPIKPHNNGGSVPPKRIQRAPSMPPLIVREKDHYKNGSDFTRSKLVHHQASDPVVLQEASKPHCAKMKGHHRSDCSKRKSKLLRTPSLPSSIGRDEKFQANGSRTTGRSHTQPSTPTHSDNLPPRQTSKSCSIPRSRSVRNCEVESFNTEGAVEMRRRFLNQKTMRRSLSDLESEEVQGFKDLGFKFEKECLSPSLANIIPGLQEKNRDETEEDKAARGPYLSEAWLVQTCAAPPIPSGASSINMSASDMKQQIKFWARAVASNVYQEC